MTEQPDYLVIVNASDRNTAAKSQGTGIFLSPELILTCRHVIWNEFAARGKVTVTLQDGTTVPATIAAADKEKKGRWADLAVLRLNKPQPGITIPAWAWPGGDLFQEKVYLHGFPEERYSCGSHRVEHKSSAVLQLVGSVDGGISGGVVEIAMHPYYCCVGVVSESDFKTAKVIAMPAIEEFLARHGLPPLPNFSRRAN